MYFHLIYNGFNHTRNEDNTKPNRASTNPRATAMLDPAALPDFVGFAPVVVGFPDPVEFDAEIARVLQDSPDWMEPDGIVAFERRTRSAHCHAYQGGPA
jgi:hypothetical protein